MTSQKLVPYKKPKKPKKPEALKILDVGDATRPFVVSRVAAKLRKSPLATQDGAVVDGFNDSLRRDFEAVAFETHPSPVVAYLGRHRAGPSKSTARAGLRVLAKLLANAPTPIGTGDYETVPWWTLTYAHTSWLRGELERTCKPETANLRLAALRGVLKACTKLEDQDGRPLMTFEALNRALPEGVKGESLHRGRALEPRELKALFQVCEGPLALRDRALLALLFGCGLRRSELVTLELESYREIVIDGQERASLRVAGKGNKEREVPVPPIARKHVDAWLAERGDEPGPLVYACRGSRLAREGISATGIYERLKVLADLASIEHVAPHDLRRSYISTMLDQPGVDVITVSKLVGHVKLETTAKYDKRGERAKREAAEGFEVPE